MRLVFGIGDALDDFGRAPLSGPARRDPLPGASRQNGKLFGVRVVLAIGAPHCVPATLKGQSVMRKALTATAVAITATLTFLWLAFMALTSHGVQQLVTQAGQEAQQREDCNSERAIMQKFWDRWQVTRAPIDAEKLIEAARMTRSVCAPFVDLSPELAKMEDAFHDWSSFKH